MGREGEVDAPGSVASPGGICRLKLGTRLMLATPDRTPLVFGSISWASCSPS